MAAPSGHSYKPNVFRAVTKKWKEASQANYGGDDWGDDTDDDDDYAYNQPPAPASAGNQRHPGWGPQGQTYSSNPSFTNPPPSRGAGRESFDRGDERRYFSGAGGHLESPYPTTQRPPFSESQPDSLPPQNFRPQPPLQVNTQSQGPYPPAPFRPNSRGGQQYPSHPTAPFSAPGGYPHQRSYSGNRSNPDDVHQRRESPVRPDSRASNNSARYFPPRKSSLSQQQPPPGIPGGFPDSTAPSQTATPPIDAKALPFIRPSDIYKRMEEEREKERRSQESSRPSLDSASNQPRDMSADARSATSASREDAPTTQEDTDSNRRLKPTLDPVQERKSEYGFDNMLNQAGNVHPSVKSQNEGVNRHPTNASSVYTDRPDPVSASTGSREDSPRGDSGNEEPYSASSYQHNLPPLGTVSSLGSDIGSSLAPATTSTAKQPDHPPPPVPDKDSTNHLAPSDNIHSENLSHKPSLGYRSAVEHAFDHSQGQYPMSPVSGDESLPRSNSASTSEISPIISRRQDPPHGPSGPPVTDQPIPEEPTFGHSRVVSDSTIRAGDDSRFDQALPAPPVILSDYRRDRTPPSRDNSPAKQPLSVQTAPTPRPGYGVVGSTEDVHQDTRDEGLRGRPGPSGAAPGSRPPGVPSLKSPTSNHSTTSDEYKEWQDQRKQFNARFGIQDSNPTTPGIPSPISRTESPNKGSVKDMAQKYETNSGRNTPMIPPSSDYLNARPAPQSRLESFRPQIPGGWQSSTTTPQIATPGLEPVKPPQPPRLADQRRFESTDSIPTARVPQNWQQERNAPASTAFAAAAAAGTALAGAFSGTAFSRQRQRSPEHSDSEDSWERSAASSIHEPDASIYARDFGTADETKDTSLVAPAQTSLPPTPLPKDTPVATSPPAKVAPRTTPQPSTASEDDPSRSDYFPAPLRTSKSADVNETMRPPVPMPHHDEETPMQRYNEQLQQDIVKSLTPKSSNVDSQADQEINDRTPTKGRNAAPGAHDSTQTSDRDANPLPERPQTPPQSAAAGAPRRPFIEQRFSWEMEPAAPSASALTKHSAEDAAPATPSKTTSPLTASPVTPRAVERIPSVTSVPEAHDLSSPRSATTPRPVSGEEAAATPTALNDPGHAPNFNSSNRSSTHHELPFRKILAMENQKQRIEAFNTSRDSYAHSDGMLDQWIHHMQTPEHANVFQSSGQVRPSVTTGQNASHRFSPNRPLPSIGGSKLMQTDGKKLMDASKRFGGKTGVAAKGLFAKGKDKWRSVSAGEKGFLTSRRKSAGPDLFESNEPGPETSKRDSTFLTAPPQLPAPDLSSSPINGDNWFGSERNNQDVQPVISNLSTAESNRFSAVSRDSRVDQDHSRPATRTRSRSSMVSIPSRPGTSQEVEAKHEAAAAGRDEVPPSVETPSTRYQEIPKATPIVEQPDSDWEVIEHSSAQDDGRADQPPQDESSRDSGLLGVPGGHAATTNGPDSPDAEGNLAVPEPRRLSVISRVSSASPSPAASHEDQNLRRSVSPAEPIEPRDEAVPSYRPGVPLAKEDEAKAERQADHAEDDPLPSYDEGVAVHNEGGRRRIGPDAQILPVADLSRQRRQQEISRTDRPFSFEGSEYLNQAIRANEKNGPLQSPPSAPLSPVSQRLSNQMSQVSAEEAVDDRESTKKPTKSYSRPFGADPSRDHPAFRQQEVEAIDRSRMYSSESPLPSARRPQQTFEENRRQSPAPVVEPKREDEGGYRIPGPHFQELRSPRRSSGQDHLPAVQQFRQENGYQQPARVNQYPHHQYQAQPQPAQPPPQQPQSVMGPPPTPPSQTRAKRPKFGGFFQSKSKTRLEPEQIVNGNQRPPLPKQSSRQDSVRSQHSSMNENRDVVGQLPQNDKSKRRLSRDMLRSPTPTDPSDGKKKRFSAMGNLFSRGSRSEKPGSPQRASTLPTNAAPPSREKQPVSAPPQQYYPRPDQPGANGQFERPERERRFSGSPPPAGGYYAPMEQQRVNTSAQQQQQYPYDYQQSVQVPAQRPQPEARPSDLRIDTAPGRNSPVVGGPVTAPPQTYTSRDISYQSRPYEYQSPARVQSPTTTYAPPSASVPASRSRDEHVVALHKRSRSPKLGRPPSSEDLHHLSLSPAGGDPGTPVEGLGTFSNKKISPVGGIPRPEHDQEAPYRIDIPGGELGEEERKRRTRQNLIEKGGLRERGNEAAKATSPTTSGGQTVAERLMGPQLPASGAKRVASPVRQQSKESASTDKSRRFVAELPGSKAQGYESEEEIPMSATAYPGQWQDPVFFWDGKDD